MVGDEWEQTREPDEVRNRWSEGVAHAMKEGTRSTSEPQHTSLKESCSLCQSGRLFEKRMQSCSTRKTQSPLLVVKASVYSARGGATDDSVFPGTTNVDVKRKIG